MRTKIMEYHRHFTEAREARRQAEYDQIGEHILANASNWLRVPGQRRNVRPSPYRVPTPHPSHRREEPGNEEEWFEEEDGDNGVRHPDRVHGYAPRQPPPIQRSGGRRARHPIYRRYREDGIEDHGAQDTSNTPDNVTQRYSQLATNNNEKADGPTPEEEIQAIVRNVQQRRQVVVIQPIFPFPNYSAGEIVDDRATDRNRGNARPTAANTTRRNAITNPCLHYLNRSQRSNVSLDVLFPGHSLSENGVESTNHARECLACRALNKDLPLPPGYSSDSNEDQIEELPVFSLPQPALDLSSANLTGSLFHQGPDATPGGFFHSSPENKTSITEKGSEDSRREYEVVAFEHIEDVGDVAASQSRSDQARRREYEKVAFEDVEYAGADKS